MNCYLCSNKNVSFSFIYDGVDEFAEKVTGKSALKRKWYDCPKCDALLGEHVPGSELLYEDEYYQDESDKKKSIENRFEKIMSLPESQSDNRQRVKRIKNGFSTISEILNLKIPQNRRFKILDIGSGLGVFLSAFLDEKWDGVGIEPDKTACELLESKTKARAVCGYFGKTRLDGKFDLITLNRVLEHTDKPVNMLKSLHANLHEKSIVYLELPHVLSLKKYGTKCDQFNCTHYFAVSAESVIHLARRTSFYVMNVNSVLDPSGKLTLYAFLIKSQTAKNHQGTKTQKGWK